MSIRKRLVANCAADIVCTFKQMEFAPKVVSLPVGDKGDTIDVTEFVEQECKHPIPYSVVGSLFTVDLMTDAKLIDKPFITQNQTDVVYNSYLMALDSVNSGLAETSDVVKHNLTKEQPEQAGSSTDEPETIEE